MLLHAGCGVHLKHHSRPGYISICSKKRRPNYLSISRTQPNSIFFYNCACHWCLLLLVAWGPLHATTVFRKLASMLAEKCSIYNYSKSLFWLRCIGFVFCFKIFSDVLAGIIALQIATLKLLIWPTPRVAWSLHGGLV